MRRRMLMVIPEPAAGSRVVFLKDEDDDSTVFVEGKGDIDLVCGACFAVLAMDTERNQIENIVLRCNKCGSYNDASTIY